MGEAHLVAPFAFDADFLEFARQRDWVAHLDGDVAVLANRGGEIRYSVQVGPGSLIMIARAERSEGAKPVGLASDSGAVHRYLASRIGIGERDAGDLLLLWPVDPDDRTPGNGFHMVELDDGWFALADRDGSRMPIQLGWSDAMSYSYVARVALHDLYASFADPRGLPALHDAWLRWQGRQKS